MTHIKVLHFFLFYSSLPSLLPRPYYYTTPFNRPLTPPFHHPLDHPSTARWTTLRPPVDTTLPPPVGSTFTPPVDTTLPSTFTSPVGPPPVYTSPSFYLHTAPSIYIHTTLPPTLLHNFLLLLPYTFYYTPLLHLLLLSLLISYITFL